MSSSLKDLQCIAVCTGEDCSETKAVMPLTQRIGRLQKHHIILPTDEPCWQSCAARGRPRQSYREHHRSAPVKLTAAQSGPWHRPANYRPSRMYAATRVEYPDRGLSKEAQKKKTNSKQKDEEAPQREEGQVSKTGKAKRRAIWAPN